MTYLKSRLARHDNVEQSQIHCPVLDRQKGFLAVLDRDNFVALSGKNVRKKLTIRVIVISNQNSSFASGYAQHGAPSGPSASEFLNEKFALHAMLPRNPSWEMSALRSCKGRSWASKRQLLVQFALR
jgi:hypothetical protein